MAGIALAHDYLLVMRGAERTFATLADAWPAAPVFTLLFDEDGMRDRFAGHRVVASALQRLGVRQSGFRRLLPLFPAAVERLRVQPYDVVVSSSSAFAHGVRPGPGATHVCYCHSPFRYAWFEQERALGEVPAAARPVLAALLERQRSWDRAAAGRVTRYVANSRITRDRIAEIYGREADVVHPPVEVARFAPRPEGPEDFVLIVCELVRHKSVELAPGAARRAGRPIKVVGTGPDRERLEALHGDHAQFLGRVDDAQLDGLYPRALALVVPNVEEFGIAAVEVQAAGRPVVGLDRGGTSETVRPGETGVLVPAGDADALTEVLRETDFARFDPAACVASAARFSPEAFKDGMRAAVDRAVAASS